jgi:uncharacterized membrane protein HdeD (DUF308 family)
LRRFSSDWALPMAARASLRGQVVKEKRLRVRDLEREARDGMLRWRNHPIYGDAARAHARCAGQVCRSVLAFHELSAAQSLLVRAQTWFEHGCHGTNFFRNSAPWRWSMDQTLRDVDLLARNCWAIFVRALLACFFGIFALLEPGLSLAALVMAFGAYALVDGVFATFAALQRRRDNEAPRWAYLWMGLSGFIAGGAALLWPGATLLALLYVVAAWALIQGALQIASAIRLRREIRGEWILALSGVASLAFGAALIAFPAASAVVLVQWLGIYALVYGVMLLALALRLRSWEKKGLSQAVQPALFGEPAQSDTGGR